MNAAFTYDGTTLKMVLTDLATSRAATFSWPVNIPTIVGGPTAYFGFTAGTGGLSMTSLITSWTYAPRIGAKPAPLAVDLSTSYNHYGIVTHGNRTPPGYVDGGTSNYSSQALGTSATWNGATFKFGPANALDTVANRQVTLPAGNYSALYFLGAGVNGNQPSQPFIVTYTDGTTSTVSVSLSDWVFPQGYPGETTVVTMIYRDKIASFFSTGRDNVTTRVFGYSLPLDGTKTVARITLPANNNVVVMSMALAY